MTTTINAWPATKTPEQLATGFWNSFECEEKFQGSEETIHWAYAIVEAGDAMWNHPGAVADAEAYIAGNA